jgi:hypothetical protein
MKQFVIYNNEGKILRTGSCPDDMFDIQCGDNESIIEGTANDDMQHVVDGVVVDKPAATFAEKVSFAALELRQIRNELLRDSDWTQMTDSPLSDSKKNEWSAYRQLLRDLPADHEDVTSISEVNFPGAPT